MSHNVKIAAVDKIYGDFKAVDQVSLDIKSGEFFTLLGPSGCGKTTLLRMIAGFNSIEAGQIFFDTQCINNVPAHKRNIGMVFQNYAIFPHLTVFENVAYGLKARNVPKQEIATRVEKALELIQIGNLKDRKPNQLSGGQQQRVALARAIVIEPQVLLMDEPLSNLDAKLRVQMRTIIKKLQRSLGITTIYVTHDQEEALAISDRIAIMRSGKVMQVGTPLSIYAQPEHNFVANFIGTSNSLPVTVKDGKVELENYRLRKQAGNYTGQAILSARPEQISLLDEPAPDTLQGKITLATFLGDYMEYEVELTLNGVKKIVLVNEYFKDQAKLYAVGASVYLRFAEDKISFFAADSETLI